MNQRIRIKDLKKGQIVMEREYYARTEAEGTVELEILESPRKLEVEGATQWFVKAKTGYGEIIDLMETEGDWQFAPKLFTK